ncbi:hypothetical protein FHS79_003630 [Polymorphobacter multimanifer]|uniref:Uncharacterized protein n=1 Tax=Polymorphobacter multimanifer TaxID=1070431 RepID=A0A841LKC6_9SPHN|nr:hypothetical protein [Polymorphobacter multimanifer]
MGLGCNSTAAEVTNAQLAASVKTHFGEDLSDLLKE